MISSILLWLAEWLIKYFLNRNYNLAKDLQAGVDHTKQHDIELRNLQDSLRIHQADIDAANSKLADAAQKLMEINDKIQVIDNERKQQLAEYEAKLNSTSDDDVLHSDLHSDLRTN